MSRVSFSTATLLLFTAAGCRDAGTGPQSSTIALASPADVGPYELVDLGTLGGSSGTAKDVNNRGQVVGTSATAAGTSHAFLWEDGVMTDLGTLGGEWSDATDVNASGQIVGYSADASGASHAFLWRDGVMQDLGPAVNYRTVRLNARGQVTWTAPQPDGTYHAVLWTDGVLQDLGTLGGGSEARAINDVGQVAGTSNDHAFLWDGTVMQDLGSLGGHAWAADVNNEGHVVGASYTPYPEPRLHALVWIDGQMIDIGTPYSDANAHAVAINDDGQVAALSLSLGFERGKPYLWEAGVLTPLKPVDESGRTEFVAGINQEGVVVGRKTLFHSDLAVVSDHGTRVFLPVLSDLGTSASAINDRGDVAGDAWVDSSTRHAVLWRSGSTEMAAGPARR